MTLEGAYEVPGLERVRRSLRLSAEGELTVEDAFATHQGPLAVEEAFVTWYDASAEGRTARVTGEKYVLELTIELPEDARFELEVLEEESRENHKPFVLRRLSFLVSSPLGQTITQVRARVLARQIR
jgi:hypothetical protein